MYAGRGPLFHTGLSFSDDRRWGGSRRVAAPHNSRGWSLEMPGPHTCLLNSSASVPKPEPAREPLLAFSRALFALALCESLPLIEQNVDGDRPGLESIEIALERGADGAELRVERADAGIVAIALENEDALCE